MNALICGNFAPSILEAIVKSVRGSFKEIWISIPHQEKSIAVCNIPCDRIIRLNFDRPDIFSEISKEDKENLFVIFDGWFFCLKENFKLDFEHWLELVQGIKGSIIITPKIWYSASTKQWIGKDTLEIWEEFQQRIRFFIEIVLNSATNSSLMAIPPVFEQLCYLLGAENLEPISKLKVKWLPENLLYGDIGFLSLDLFLNTLKEKLSRQGEKENWFTILAKDLMHSAKKSAGTSLMSLLDSGNMDKILLQPCTWKYYLQLIGKTEKESLLEVSMRAKLMSFCANLETNL